MLYYQMEQFHGLFKQIAIHQHKYKDGLINKPLLIFAEGCTSNGEYMLSFKKGPFQTLLPV